MSETPTTCPHCGEVLQYAAGMRAACPVCGEPVAGTGWTTAAVTAAAPPPYRTDDMDAEAEPLFVAAAPTCTLASAAQVGWASFLGGPLAGWMLIARNYFKIGRRAAGCATWVIGIFVTMAALGIALLLPDRATSANLLFASLFTAVAYVGARFLQGGILDEHRIRGGTTASGWVVFGYTLASITLILGVTVGGAYLYDELLGDRRLAVTADEEIYYGRDIDLAEAQALGRVLQQLDIFDGEGGKSIGLHREGETYVVAVVLLFGHDDAETQASYQRFAVPMSLALGGKPVRIDLCDQEGSARAKLPVVRGL